MFKHCELVRILVPETLFDADDSLVLGVVLGMYCTRYFDMYFSSPLAPPLVGVWLLDDGVTEDVDDGAVVTEPEVHTEGLVDCGVELGAGRGLYISS